jgi:hypothetical protein
MNPESKDMNTNKIMWIVLLMLAFLPSLVNAEAFLIVRPQAGYGYMDSSDSSNNGKISHAGLRILLNAGESRRYGLEATRFRLSDGGYFSSLGVVLEQRLWSWFNMSIGTVGYFDYGNDSKNPVGLMTNLGWEPSNSKNFKPFITYRNDTIFSENTDTAHSISIGFTFTF